MNKSTKRKIGKVMSTVFRCIGWSIAFMYIGGLFFVPGMILFCMLISFFIDGSGPTLEHICIPICMVYLLGCFGYACYSVGQEGK